jgi:hypothetical protein
MYSSFVEPILDDVQALRAHRQPRSDIELARAQPHDLWRKKYVPTHGRARRRALRARRRQLHEPCVHEPRGRKQPADGASARGSAACPVRQVHVHPCARTQYPRFARRPLRQRDQRGKL